MISKKNTTEELINELRSIESQGITANKEKLSRDMCSQFTDPNLWVREYAVNAFDAMATKCEVFGEEEDNEITISIKDNGHGMDRQTLNDFFTLYRSRKKYNASGTVGRFGIGKVSVAAIPGQTKLFVRTSNGETCFEAVTGSFLKNDPIRIYNVTPVPEPGTIFKISFRKKENLSTVMLKLADILYRYLRFLPMQIIIYHVKEGRMGLNGMPQFLNEDWSAGNDVFGHTYKARIQGIEYEILLSLGQVAYEIYQNKVFISDSYNLLKFRKEKNTELPYLRIRVESTGFELPFGRHRLNNEEVIEPLSDHIRETLFPSFWDELVEKVWINGEYFRGFTYVHLEEMAIALIYLWTDLNKSWCQIPVFNIYPHRKVSLVNLEKMVVNAGKIYLASSDNTGMNYTGFDGPVLMQDQPGNCLKLLQNLFAGVIIDLNLNDTVMEAPANNCPELTLEDINLEYNLGFNKEMLSAMGKRFLNTKNQAVPGSGHGKDLNEMDCLFPEIRKAGNDFEKLKWKVNYLVNRDLSPCMTHRFIIVHNTVTLNLYHKDVLRLVKICRQDPKLAGHWAMAMCLTEDNRLLPHLTSESREDLLMLDAIARILTENDNRQNINTDELRKMRQSFWDLLNKNNINLNMN